MTRAHPLTGLAVGQTLAWASIYYLFPPLLLRWEMAMGWSKAEITGAFTLAILTSAVCSPIAGRIIDVGRGASLMAGSAILSGVTLIALSMVDALWQFIGLWVVMGVAFAGCLYEPCFAIVTRTKGDAAKRGIVFISLVAGFASTVSFPIVHSLAELMGWRTTVALCGAVAILVVAPMLGLAAAALERGDGSTEPHRQRPQQPSTATASASRSILTQPIYWFLAIGFACSAVVHGTTLHHLLPFLDETGLPAAMAVLVASFIGPMQVAGRLAMMAAERFVSHHSVAIASFLLMGLSVALLAIGNGTPASLVGFALLFGGAYGTVSILRPVITREVLGARNFGVISGAVALPYLIGAAVSPYLGSLLWGVGGYGLMFGTAVSLSLMGCALYLLARRGRA